MSKLKILIPITCLALCLVCVMFVKALLALNVLVELLLRLLTKYY